MRVSKTTVAEEELSDGVDEVNLVKGQLTSRIPLDLRRVFECQ